jgi:aminocarboxymuconate-semialdehyde decarboxylase
MTETDPQKISAEGYPTVDFHTHVLDPEVYAKTINHNVMTGFGTVPTGPRPEAGSSRAPTFERMTDPHLHLSEMDERGVDVHVISTSTVSQGTWWAEPRQAADLDRAANEGIARWVKAHPQRFVGTFTLPMQSLELALEECEYAVGTLGLKVANLPANINGLYLGDPQLRPLWTAFDRLGVVVWIHPDGVKDQSFQKYFLWNGIGQPIEETRVIASLMYEGVLDAFPNVKIVISHGGGYLPHYMARLDRNAAGQPATRKNLTRMPSEYLKCLYYDTCVYAPSVLEDLIRYVGIDRIVLGSDYPVGDKDPFAVVRNCRALSKSDVETVTRRTPASILGLAARPFAAATLAGVSS